MKKKNIKKKQKVSTKRSRRCSELKKSLRKPGISDLMFIYEYWEKANKTVKTHQDTKENSYIGFNSNSSNLKLSL